VASATKNNEDPEPSVRARTATRTLAAGSAANRWKQSARHGFPLTVRRVPLLDSAKSTRQKAKRGAALRLPLTTLPMEAKLADELPAGDDWQFEPKWDGFRCLAFRNGDRVELRSKSGKPLTRYFPEIVSAFSRTRLDRFVVDGELVIERDGGLSFHALQMRLHPAESRIRKLAAETPATFIAFDLLLNDKNESLLDQPQSKRRTLLETLFVRLKADARITLSPVTTDRRKAAAWLRGSGTTLDGVIAKPLDGRYRSGERAMLKVKRLRTADCVVGGFRYGEGTKEVASLLLGLYNDKGKLDHVGFTSSIPKAARGTLTKHLEALKAPPGFSGNAPGGPSRWSTERSAAWMPVKPVLVAEVRYDHVTEDRFRHGTNFLRWRPDKSPRQCTFDQL
jgi:ATP-dependent DNA ligase